MLELLFDTYTKARIDQLFNIIIEFPDSQVRWSFIHVKQFLLQTATTVTNYKPKKIIDLFIFLKL